MKLYIIAQTGDADGNSFLPFMEGMMQSLLSAEILLPSIKELLEKYPKYLEENDAKLSAEDKERWVNICYSQWPRPCQRERNIRYVLCLHPILFFFLDTKNNWNSTRWSRGICKAKSPTIRPPWNARSSAWSSMICENCRTTDNHPQRY